MRKGTNTQREKSCRLPDVGQGGTTKSDLEHQGQIWYNLGFEGLGLGFGGEQARK